MNRNEFIKRLDQSIASLPNERRSEILEDINRHFDEGMEDGVPEEELCGMLGSPEALGREYMADNAVKRAEKNPTAGNVLRMIWAGIGMGMLNIMIAFPIWVSLAAVCFSLAVTSAALILGGLASIVLTATDFAVPLSFVMINYPLISIFAGISMTALGGLLGIGSYQLLHGFVKITTRYVQSNIDVITGRRRVR